MSNSGIDAIKSNNMRLMSQERDIQEAQKARIEAIKNKQKQAVEETRLENEKELLDLHDRSQAKILENINAREQKLERGREVIRETSEMLDKTRRDLTNQKMAELDELKFTQDQRYQQAFQNGQDVMHDLNSKTAMSVQQLNSETEDAIQALTIQNKERVDTVTKLGESRAQDKAQEFRRLGAYQDLEFSKIIRQKEFDHQKDVDELERKFTIEKEGRIQSFAQQRDFKINEQQETLTQLDRSFKEKYDSLVANHDLVMNNLKNRFEADLKAELESVANTRSTIEDKNGDPFYSVTKLSPMLAEDEKSYTISLNVPEHERDLVNLAADGRKLKLTVGRRFEERLEGQQGQVDKTVRTEHHTKIFDVGHIVDQRQITQNYQDGLLSYKIMKA